MLRSLVSRSALVAGARRAVAAQGAGTADLRRDAWGHGLADTARAMAAGGVRAVRVDGPAEVAELAALGLDATHVGEPDLDPALIYGLPGSDGALRGEPALRAVGRVLSTKDIEAGGGVSYGYIYRAPEDSRLALVTGGYAQGVVRALGNRAFVEIDGCRHRVVGRIAMDVCVVDIGDADVALGADVTFFGGRGPLASGLAEWSTATGMTAGELVAVVGQRTERVWID
ncbi:MAG: hypothetical protein JSS74_07120 [Actinobacteria bacterium]|nr:hypothetical protein [Actinomycetota bacterium]